MRTIPFLDYVASPRIFFARKLSWGKENSSPSDILSSPLDKIFTGTSSQKNRQKRQENAWIEAIASRPGEHSHGFAERIAPKTQLRWWQWLIPRSVCMQLVFHFCKIANKLLPQLRLELMQWFENVGIVSFISIIISTAMLTSVIRIYLMFSLSPSVLICSLQWNLSSLENCKGKYQKILKFH